MSDVEISALERRVKAEPNDLELRATLCQQLKRAGRLQHELALELAAALGDPVAGRLTHPNRDQLCEAGLMRRQSEILVFATPAGLSALAGLPVAKLDLQLSRTLPRDAFAALRGLPLLELSLDLNSCDGVNDMAASCLSLLKKLELLILHATSITDLGIAKLAGLPLRELGLNGARKVTNASIDVLKTLPLTRLWCHGSGITDPGRARLRAALAAAGHDAIVR